MEGFKLTSASATADEALAAADQLEQAVGEICNGNRRASNVPMEPMAVLVQFARDNGHLAALLDRTQSENEALAQRLAVRMEELQQAVQARLAAEEKARELADGAASLVKLVLDTMKQRDIAIAQLWARSPEESAKLCDQFLAQGSGKNQQPIGMEELHKLMQELSAEKTSHEKLQAALNSLLPKRRFPFSGSPIQEAKNDGYNEALAEVGKRIAAITTSEGGAA